MELKEIIYEKWKEAFKSRNIIEKEAFEAIKARIVTLEKAKANTVLTNEDVESLIRKEIKELVEERVYQQESSVIYTNLTQKINLLSAFLPKQLSEAEVIEIIKQFAETEQNKGKLIGKVIKEVGNKYDRSKIAPLVQKTI